MKLIAMDLIHGLRTKHYNHHKIKSNVCRLSPNAQLLAIKLPNSLLLKMVARTMLFALALASLPWITTLLENTMNFSGSLLSNSNTSSNSIRLETFPLLFRDLSNEGLLKTGDKALFVGREYDEAIYDSQVLNNMYINFISEFDAQAQSVTLDGTFDLALTNSFHGEVSEFIDRTLKLGGIVITIRQIGDQPALEVPNKLTSNYKIVYVRHFGCTIVVMKKTGYIETKSSPTMRRLFGAVVTPEEKKAALKKLEDVLLEPPRTSSRKLKTYLKKTRYLPDLIDDSLESYSRRVFVNVEKDDSDVGWFEKHYPRKNKNFEVYRIKTVTPEEVSSKETPDVGLSDWLQKNVREEEYVVMKAEAEVVEEMVKNRAMRLVDELFMECKHQGLGGKGRKNRRAYWECLALYGRLRDEGVAVHQWWG